MTHHCRLPFAFRRRTPLTQAEYALMLRLRANVPTTEAALAKTRLRNAGRIRWDAKAKRWRITPLGQELLDDYRKRTTR